MAIKLKVSDNSDGTGVKTTILGTPNSGRLTVENRIKIFNNVGLQQGSESVAYQTTLEGNGSHTFEIPTGPYFAILEHESTLENATDLRVDTFGPVPFRVTDTSEQGNHFMCASILRDFVLALQPVGMTADPARHKIHKEPRRSVKEIITQRKAGQQGVHYWPMSERTDDRHNRLNRVEYLVQMVWIAFNDKQLAVDPFWLQARQQLRNSLESVPFASAVAVYDVQVQPLAIYDESARAESMDLQSLMFVFHIDELAVVN